MPSEKFSREIRAAYSLYEEAKFLRQQLARLEKINQVLRKRNKKLAEKLNGRQDSHFKRKARWCDE